MKDNRVFVLVHIGEGPVACSKNKEELLKKMEEYPDGSRFNIFVVDML